MYPVSVKGVLLSPNAEVVLLLNEREEWELPGGRLEPGESSTECLAREFLEELGLRVQVGSPLNTYLFEVLPARHVFIATYRCRLCGPFEPALSSEHRRIGLFAPSALPENLPQGYRSSIAAALAEPDPPSTAMNSVDASQRQPVVLGPGEGRSYPMGRIAALFKADGAETQDRYSISEWWLEPHTQGPGTHSHSEDDIFYVIEGTMSVLVGGTWTHAEKGRSCSCRAASPTTSRTAAMSVRGC